MIAKAVVILALLLLAFAVPAAQSSPSGSPPPPVPADALVPSVAILNLKLGARAPTAQHLTRVGTEMYRATDHGVRLSVWRSRNGIVDHVEAQRAGSLRVYGHRLSEGYRAFRTILTREHWKPFGCGDGVRGFMLMGRSQSLTFIRWSRRSVWASVSLRSQPPIFGVCEGLSGPPPPAA